MHYNKTVIKLIMGSIIIPTVLHGGELSDGSDLHHLEHRDYTDYLPRISPITDSSAVSIVGKYQHSFLCE